MARRLKTAPAGALVLGALALLHASQPQGVSPGAMDAPREERTAGVSPEVPPLAPAPNLLTNPVPVSVAINGKPTPPAPGSASGVWFYADGATGTQVLLTGHATVLGSWRLTASFKVGDEIRLSFLLPGATLTNLLFQAEQLSPTELQCRTDANSLVITGSSVAGGRRGNGSAEPRPTGTGLTDDCGPAAVRLTHFAIGEAPFAFAPVRRPFSRDPVRTSPDPHPAIAEALVEWDWRMQDGIQTPREPRTYTQAMEKLVRQTDALVTERRKSNTLGLDGASRWTALRAADLAAMDDPTAEAHWLELHRFRRQLMLSDPLFQLPPLLFVKHVPSVMSHQLTQVYGYCARPGGGLFVLTEPGRSMRTRDLTPDTLTPGNFMTPELAYDGGRLLFAHCPVKEAPSSWDFTAQTRHLRYHVYELCLDSGAVRPLTAGDTDNFSPVALPGGDVLFVSTRRGGFHRCGRGPCFVYTLARMGPDGQDPRSISFHETHEWDPCLLNDGRVVYTRWDYVDRNAVHYEQLWSALPDGSHARIFYGNNTWNPTGIWEARAIPGSTRVMATAAPHHGMSAGSVILVDTALGVDGPAPLTRLTPDVRFPESESPLAFGPSPTAYDFDTPVAQHWRSPLVEPWSETSVPEEEKRWPGHCYKSPWPLSETFFIVSYSFDQLVGEPGPNLPNMFGLYFADAFGNKELIYRDPAISSLWARPLVARRAPPELACSVVLPGQGNGLPPPLTRPSASARGATADKSGTLSHPMGEGWGEVSRPAHSTDSSVNAERGFGTFFVHNVREGWPSLPDGAEITQLRLVQVLLKTTPNADAPRVGAAFAAPGKQVLGTVPVEPDGSAYFQAPARTPLLFQALDARGRAIQTMRSLVYLQPGENQSCIGCHEHRLKTASRNAPPQAIRRAPSVVKSGPDGSLPFSYPRLVQPVLDRHCVRCHDGQEPGRPVLTGEPEGVFTKSYNALVSRVSFSAWNRPEQNFEPLTEPLRFGALASPLAKLLEDRHHDIALSSEDEERLFTWMDANALFYGTFDVDEQRKQLAGDVIEAPQP